MPWLRTLARYPTAISTDHVQEFYDFVQVKTLIWLLKSSAGRDKKAQKLIITFMRPYNIILLCVSLHKLSVHLLTLYHH